jgi:hypothetical protein
MTLLAKRTHGRRRLRWCGDQYLHRRTTGRMNHLTPGSPFRVRMVRAGEVLELPDRMP